MKKYISSKACEIMNNIEGVSERESSHDLLDMLIENASSFSRTPCDMIKVAEAFLAIQKKNAKDETFARRISDLEDSTNYWARRCDEMQDEIRSLRENAKSDEDTIDGLCRQINTHIDKHVVGYVPRDHDDYTLMKGRIYYVGKIDGTAFNDGDMSKKVRIKKINGNQVIADEIRIDDIISDNMIFDDVSTTYVFELELSSYDSDYEARIDGRHSSDETW